MHSFPQNSNHMVRNSHGNAKLIDECVFCGILDFDFGLGLYLGLSGFFIQALFRYQISLHLYETRRNTFTNHVWAIESKIHLKQHVLEIAKYMYWFIWVIIWVCIRRYILGTVWV